MSEELKVESKNKLSKKFLLFAIIGIGIIMIVAISLIVPTSVRAKEVEEQLSLGDKYLSELNYEQAEVAYLAVLKIDPKCEDAYIGLASVYIATGQYEKAEEILDKAEEQLGETEAIKKKREELERKRKEQEEKLQPTATNTPVPTATSTPMPNREGIEGYFEYVIKDGNVRITKFNGNDSMTEVDIPEKIQGYPVTSIGEWVFWDCSSLNIITPVGSYAETYAKENNIPYENN